MKIHGKKLGPRVETVVFPRPDGDVVIQARCITDFEDFEKLCPTPEPPKVRRASGEIFENIEDAGYKTRMDEHGKRRGAWIAVQSLQATPGLEWENVKPEDPETWASYDEELAEFGLSPGERSRVTSCILDACGLNQSKIDEATKRFLATQASQ